MHPPLERFQTVPLWGWITDGVLASFAVFVVIAVISLCRLSILPGPAQLVLEGVYEWVADQLGPRGGTYVPLVMTLFFYIATANLLGLFPNVFPITSHLSVTFGLSITVFLLCLSVGLFLNTRKFVHHFFIPGVPWVVSPLVAAIEAVVFCMRPVTLAARLAINMTVGHILLEVLGGLVETFGPAGAPLFFVTLFANLLEVAVCLIQAGVFTILASQYIKADAT